MNQEDELAEPSYEESTGQGAPQDLGRGTRRTMLGGVGAALIAGASALIERVAAARRARLQRRRPRAARQAQRPARRSPIRLRCRVAGPPRSRSTASRRR
jgi:hypothetical protein